MKVQEFIIYSRNTVNYLSENGCNINFHRYVCYLLPELLVCCVSLYAKSSREEVTK